MKGTVIKNSCAALVAVAFLVSPADIAEAKSKRKILREYKGWYVGRCFGAIGKTTGVQQNVTPVKNYIRAYFGGPEVIPVKSPTDKIHQLIWRRTRIRSKKIVNRSVYMGDFTNPNNSSDEDAYGTQNVTIRKKTKRVMRISDNLTEGTLSYWRLNCRLARKNIPFDFKTSSEYRITIPLRN